MREPIARYLSEFAHVSRGATWKTAVTKCNDHLSKTPLCFKGDDWMNVSLAEFMACRQNYAINRQTRMLADLREINCTGEGFDPLERDRIMLKTAKSNLLKMVFFGLTEEQEKSQQMFEFIFSMKFKYNFTTLPATRAARLNVAEADLAEINRINHLDVELYDYAKQLFYERWNSLTSRGLIVT